jgi:oryzin
MWLVDIYAPGSNIISLWNTNDSAVNTISGTSSAAAHIAGLGAYILALEGYRDPVALCQRLRAIATKDVLSGLPAGSSNLLAYNLSGL